MESDDGVRGSIGTLFKQKFFWIMMLMMLCAGASEQAVSQWASAFAEKGLGISKTMGDLLGPTLFALCMAVSRTIYGVRGRNLDLKKFMGVSVLLCAASYVIIALVPNPVIALLGCGLTGFAAIDYIPVLRCYHRHIEHLERHIQGLEYGRCPSPATHGNHGRGLAGDGDAV